MQDRVQGSDMQKLQGPRWMRPRSWLPGDWRQTLSQQYQRHRPRPAWKTRRSRRVPLHTGRCNRSRSEWITALVLMLSSSEISSKTGPLPKNACPKHLFRSTITRFSATRCLEIQAVGPQSWGYWMYRGVAAAKKSLTVGTARSARNATTGASGIVASIMSARMGRRLPATDVEASPNPIAR